MRHRHLIIELILRQTFHSNGKLLLTAEFLVIDGAKALALPSRFGQKMEVDALGPPEIHWKSFDHEGKLWFDDKFDLSVPVSASKLTTPNNKNISRRLRQIFRVLTEIKPDLFKNQGFTFETELEFPQNWGLGSSSTLISNLAQWAGVNPYELSAKTFGGSAYDIACATHNQPILYERVKPDSPKVRSVDFNPAFKRDLFFVHLNQKQNTRTVVSRYKSLNPFEKKEWIAGATALTNRFLNCKDLKEFENLIDEHETLLSRVLQMPPVKKERFPDFPGAVKSLGAWGGDFALATGGTKAKDYFRDKGYATILDYGKMVF